jgi:hypothetical protein
MAYSLAVGMEFQAQKQAQHQVEEAEQQQVAVVVHFA